MTQPTPTSDRSLWERISTNSLVRFLLFFASGWALVQLLNYFEYVIFVFTFSAILALVLNYPVQYLERFLRRGYALAIVITCGLVTIGSLAVGIGLTIADQLQDMTAVFTQILGSPKAPLEQLQNFLIGQNINLNLAPLRSQLQDWINNAASWIIGSLPTIFSNYVTLIIILVVTIFMMIDNGKLWKLLLKLVPINQREHFARAVEQSFQGFLRGQLLISLLLGLSTFVVFLFFQIPFALLLSFLVAFFDLIPGIGATLGVTIACFIVLLQSGWLVALKVLVICVILQQIQDNFLTPRIMQSTVRLNPIIIFFALLVGTRIAGLLGVFLSVPIAGVIVSLLKINELQSQ